MQKRMLVCGAGGFIGHHLVEKLKAQGHWVAGADLKYPEFSATKADEFFLGDLTIQNHCEKVFAHNYDEVYQLAADMGGAGYLFTGDNDASVMFNSSLVNLNVLSFVKRNGIDKVFYSSSACIYPEFNQMDPSSPNCEENSAYPAQPDSEYGWEKLYSERLYLAFQRNFGINVRIARFHNIFGPLGTWQGGREKVPAAFCRKVVQASNPGTIEVWGDGKQTRSFLYVEECVEGVLRLMASDFSGPVNMGSNEMVTINDLAKKIIEISGKKINLEHIPGPLGVRGRNSDNQLIEKELGWKPSWPLEKGLEMTYRWIHDQVQKDSSS